ncbi:sodium channel modifier 1 isoform X2 [Melopsittacus undulatus]|uniref:sodium channel modifier 1 isoform X2 n=1 Tax=Melopsittacus undulatus TaxID=13146 RepID=UPI00146F6237|nr:sodium channel modifier 1 isoform X2 [Melopsittacus undulatus]
MSFKRDGDDPGQLGALQRRRVAELLASFIPEEEAVLLRSGRYACAVCPHRPVFDTLEVLSVHREGRKHRSSLQRFYGRRGSVQDTAQKPQPREEEQAEGSPAPLLARTRRIAQSALLKAAPYNSCCRRTGVQGSGSRARMGSDAALVLPEPSQKEGGAAVSSTAALLLGHRAGLAATPQEQSSLCHGAAQSPEPRAAPGHGAVPAAAQLRMDPGLLRQVGEG